MEKNIQTKILKLVSRTLLLTLLTFIIYFYFNIQSVLIGNVRESNQRLTDQISSTFDTVISQIADQCSKLVVYNTEIEMALKDSKTSPIRLQDLYRALDAIDMSSRYIYSTYLVVPSSRKVYNSLTGSSYSYERFPDRELLTYRNDGKIRILEPRQYQHFSTGQLYSLFSVLVPLGFDKTLAVNIDIQRLYDDLLNQNISNPMDFYITGSDGKIFFPPDTEFFGKTSAEYLEDKRMLGYSSFWRSFIQDAPAVVHSSSESFLEWEFHVAAPVTFKLSNLFRQYLDLLFIILLVILLFAGSAVVIWRMTSPLKEAAFAYNEKIFRDILLNPNLDESSISEQLQKARISLPNSVFSLVLAEDLGKTTALSKWIEEYNLENQENIRNLNLQIVDIRPGLSALLFFGEQPQKFTEIYEPYLKKLYACLNEKSPENIYLIFSRSTTQLTGIPILYTECLRMMEYKLIINSHSIYYKEKLCTEKIEISYPSVLEKQIVNNLLVGNTEGCLQYAEKFLNELFSIENGLRDTTIRAYLYQLQSTVLREVSSMSASIKLHTEKYDLNFCDAQDIRSKLIGFLNQILAEINKKNVDEKSILEDEIFQYIEKNLASDTFNLNALSYEFNLNRYYLTKLIKERTGQTFNDYVNQKRIETAKQLLRDTADTVETISHQIGFSYAHYFIKVFKNFEGVTPGQYRDKLKAETSAEEDQKN